MQNATYTRIDHHWLNNDSFETADLKVQQERILVRVLNKNKEYWVYHKNLVDETQDQVIHKKPEEKLWKLVKTNYIPGLDFPAHQLVKNDIIKIGRVRFKIREIESEVYKEQNHVEKFLKEKYELFYPEYEPSGISESSSQTF